MFFLKKVYQGLDAILIPVDTSGKGITAHSGCKVLWTSHFDYAPFDNVCDGATEQDGTPSQPAHIEEYTNCLDAEMIAFGL